MKTQSVRGRKNTPAVPLHRLKEETKIEMNKTRLRRKRKRRINAKKIVVACWSSNKVKESACGKPAVHREVTPRKFDVHSRWKPEREA